MSKLPPRRTSSRAMPSQSTSRWSQRRRVRITSPGTFDPTRRRRRRVKGRSRNVCQNRSARGRIMDPLLIAARTKNGVPTTKARLAQTLFMYLGNNVTSLMPCTKTTVIGLNAERASHRRRVLAWRRTRQSTARQSSFDRATSRRRRRVVVVVDEFPDRLKRNSLRQSIRKSLRLHRAAPYTPPRKKRMRKLAPRRVKARARKFCVTFETGRETSFSSGTRWCAPTKPFAAQWSRQTLVLWSTKASCERFAPSSCASLALRRGRPRVYK
mmetsp:Transcript_5605/g.22014  ORF Transcript_5605/g.22014 Transcript_5605/m.22014 type:complete len:269 (-) Transcript_5605:3753-4559(-)